MLATIGHYSTISKNPQVIQGSYYDFSNDPLYIQDMSQMYIPITNPSIYKENKPYVPSPDAYVEGENTMVLKGMGMAMDKYNKKMQKGGNIQLEGYGKLDGYGLSLPGGRMKHKQMYSMVDEAVENIQPFVKKDIKMGQEEMRKMVKKRLKKIKRPSIPTEFKMMNYKREKPGEKLKKIMITKYKSKKTKPDFFNEKRDKIKELLRKLK